RKRIQNVQLGKNDDIHCVECYCFTHQHGVEPSHLARTTRGCAKFASGLQIQRLLSSSKVCWKWSRTYSCCVSFGYPNGLRNTPGADSSSCTDSCGNGAT